MKVKCFDEQHENDLSDAINEFIENKKVIDIKFSTSCFKIRYNITLELEGIFLAIKKQTFMKSVTVVLAAQLLIKFLGFIYRVILTNIEGFQDAGNSYYGTGYKVYIFITNY